MEWGTTTTEGITTDTPSLRTTKRNMVMALEIGSAQVHSIAPDLVKILFEYYIEIR